MQIGIVHTQTSQTCGCALAIARGVEALGWMSTIIDCEEMMRDPGLLKGCDTVFDHTDTLYGRGSLRPFIRFVLESHEYCVVGANARSCLLCDHKVHAKNILMEAGVPVPKGFMYRGGSVMASSDISFPVIAKSGYEHMSRALRVVEHAKELTHALREMYEEVRQPIIVEEMVGTREVEVCIIPNKEGEYTVLPFMEWIPPEGRGAVLTYARKHAGGSKCILADLPGDVADRLHTLARIAFDALRLRDYCRCDVRVGEDGSLYFLEANVIPNMEEGQGMARAALAQGMQYPQLIECLVHSALRRVGS